MSSSYNVFYYTVFTVHPEEPVFVTLSESPDLPLNTQEITPEQAQQLRHSLTSFAEEWNSPEMSIYDDYDAAKLNP